NTIPRQPSTTNTRRVITAKRPSITKPEITRPPLTTHTSLRATFITRLITPQKPPNNTRSTTAEQPRQPERKSRHVPTTRQGTPPPQRQVSAVCPVSTQGGFRYSGRVRLNAIAVPVLLTAHYSLPTLITVHGYAFISRSSDLSHPNPGCASKC